MTGITDREKLIKQAHTMAAEDVLAGLNTQQSGLSSAQVEERLKEFGLNKLPEPPPEGLLKRFFKHFHDLLIYILIMAAVVTALMGHWIDTWVILGVVIINAVIGFIQEGKAEQALEGIKRMLSANAQVRRDGNWIEIPAERLIPGDIVRLRSGDRVPADIRLINVSNLRIEESALTGESEPSEKNEHIAEPDAGIGDRHCMAYSGTLVAAGRGTGVVVATGIDTEIGRINRMIAEVRTIATPLTRQMTEFGKLLAVIILSVAGLMFVKGWLLHSDVYTIKDLFLSSIGFAVAVIPEGLPAIMTITLALGVERMARRNAITRRLNAVETLGSVTVICSDKTGTLTRNEMTARHMLTRVGLYDVSGTGYKPEGTISRGGETISIDQAEDLRRLIEVLAVCNDTELQQERGQWQVVGEPTEGALTSLASKAKFDKKPYERVAMVPFESQNKFMATLNALPGGGRRVMLKGAPDRVLDRCESELAADGSAQPLDRAFWEAKVEELASQGLRVLAAASRDASENEGTLTIADVQGGMMFLGLVGIIDPPRPEAIRAIGICHQAGIQVKMITGDHAATASSIGREMGISKGDRVVTGVEIEQASDEELRKLVKDVNIFARTSPEHKLRLVQALQANGEVVAMTGDGVNDAPALKRADVGVAMGIKGTEATKEAADIVLADDNFISIERAVEEGRTIYDNLRKAILFILPTNGAQGFVLFVAVLLGMTLPLTPVQILWVNMVVAVTLALAMAFEPAEPGVMRRPPRDPKASILGGGFLWRVAFVSLLVGGSTIVVFQTTLNYYGIEHVELARTVAVNVLVFAQAFYLFNARFLTDSSLNLKILVSNKAALLAVGLLTLFQAAFVYLPVMNTWFQTTPLELHHLVIPLAVGIVVFLLVEVEKIITRMNSRKAPTVSA